MAVTLKLLNVFSGLTSSTAGTSHTLTPGTTTKGWLVKNIMFYNYGASGQNVTVELKVKSGTGGTFRPVAKKLALTGAAASAQESYSIEQDITLDLNTPDSLQAILVSSCTTPPLVDVVINGVERDQ